MATTTTGAFVASTVQGYTVLTSAISATLSGATDKIGSTTINSSTHSIENKKIIMGIETTVAFADVAATLKIQASHNGTDWVDVVTLSADTEPNASPVEAKPYFGDLSNIFSPFFRFIFNDGALSVGTSGRLKFFFAYK